ncbi:hypothetical protein BC939DRAFT_469936, partial [Gamsiella multidivaricata]|uniref:uncharacterized protein n=1 Tax=Gamsiella multidivaricata TaxID=101098 RepID=UPI002220E386
MYFAVSLVVSVPPCGAPGELGGVDSPKVPLIEAVGVADNDNEVATVTNVLNTVEVARCVPDKDPAVAITDCDSGMWILQRVKGIRG